MNRKELNAAIFTFSLAIGLIFWCITVNPLIWFYWGAPLQVSPADSSWIGLAMAYFVICAAFFPSWMLFKVSKLD